MLRLRCVSGLTVHTLAEWPTKKRLKLQYADRGASIPRIQGYVFAEPMVHRLSTAAERWHLPADPSPSLSRCVGVHQSLACLLLSHAPLVTKYVWRQG